MHFICLELFKKLLAAINKNVKFYCPLRPNQGYGILETLDSDKVELQLRSGATGKLNTEKANNMKE